MIATTSFAFDRQDLIIDGVRVPFDTIPQLLYELTHPDPRRWYRLERIENMIVVHVRMTEVPEETHGNPIASIGSSTKDSGSGGKETPHPRNAHPQDG
jgi:hypothetical protein